MDTSLTTFGLKTRTRVGFWNVRTMFESGKLEQVSREMERYKLAIIGLSETRWNGFGEFRLRDGKTLLYSGKEEGENHESGVGILLTREARRSLLEWKPISDRIITAQFKTRVRNIYLVQCYAPTEQADAQEKDNFYGQLGEVLARIKKKDIKIVMGDLNAKIGCENEGLEKVMGKHGIGAQNDNGERFIDMCLNNRLVIGGSVFPHKLCHKVTWLSPDGKTQNQIDHFAISQMWRRSLLDVRNRRGADCGSDHHLVIAEVRLKIAATGHQDANCRQKRFNIRKLQNPDIRKEFVLELKNRYSQLEEEDQSEEEASTQVERKWNKIKKTFLNSSEKILGFQDTRRKPWISDHTWQKIEERREIKALINQCRDDEEKQCLRARYNEVHRQVKRSARSDRRKQVEQLAERAQVAAERGDSKDLYNITKQLSQKSFSESKPVRSKEGELLTNSEEQLKRWKEYFNEVFNTTLIPQEEQEQEELEQQVTPLLPINTQPPSKSEIIKALKSCKNNKAPGVDSVVAEMLKVDYEVTADMLLPLFLEIWNTETIPEDWRKGILIKLPKKGDLTKCNNWRGITLLSIPSKVLSRILLNRLREPIDSKLRKEQAGFRESRSCTDQITTLRIIIEQSMEYCSPLYMAFVDFEKAFDRVQREAIWKTMQSYGIPPKIISIVKMMYKEYTCQVKHEGKLSEPFTLNSGVRQGCLLSPLLFLLTLDGVMKKTTQEKRRGIQWTPNERLEDLDFADDICLLSHTFKDMSEKLKELEAEAQRVGLKINTAKTKEIRMNSTNKHPLAVKDEEIEQVENFCYLGSIVSKNGGAAEDVECRIKKAKGAFAQLRPVWKSREILLKVKLKIFESNVKSVLFYGCETWKVTAQIKARIQTFINKCLRIILGVRWPNVISNQELWQRTHQRKAEITIKERKWRWIGHTLRRGPQHIPKQALEWNPQGARLRGRPRLTWRRTVEAEVAAAGHSWSNIKKMAMNRVRWRALICALCSTPE